MKIIKVENVYYAIDENDITQGTGSSPIEAACNGADTLYTSGSYYWHLAVVEFLQNSDAFVLNFSNNPFTLN